MLHPIIGWEKRTPVPNHQFNELLSARNGRLYYDNLDLAQLFLDRHQLLGVETPLPTPIDLAYLPTVRRQVKKMQQAFAKAIEKTGYDGDFHYAYASKASTAEEVVRATLESGAYAELSSSVEIEIVRLMRQRGHLPPDRMVIANGFKAAGTDYAKRLVELRAIHDPLLIIIEDIADLPPLLESDYTFDVGLRQKCYGTFTDAIGMNAVNSRFGLDLEGIAQAAKIIADAPNLRLTVYHGMIGSQLTDYEAFVAGLTPAIHTYARLRQQHPHLSTFDFGGGTPAAMTLDFDFDYYAFARLMLTTFQNICGEVGVPVPDIIGEFGNYTTAEHGAHIFKVVMVKENSSALPWYIIDGSIMTSFVDVWAMNEHFTVLPLNHLDKPFQQVQLGGITCDCDDVYPPLLSKSPLYLPVIQPDQLQSDNAEDCLYVGFFNVGAYQEMMRGIPGSKYCVLPEASKLIIDRNKDNQHHFRLIRGQTIDDMLRSLRY